MATEPRFYADSVADLSDEALHCHSFGHQWDEGPVERAVPESVGIVCWMIKLRCTSCTKERRDYIEPGTYKLLWRDYSRVEHYSVADAADRTVYREEFIRRRAMKKTTTTIEEERAS